MRKRLQKKVQCATTVKTATGQVIEDKNKILEEYKTHYSTLLNTKEAKRKEEKETEQEIDQQFEELMKVAKTKQRSDITEEILIKAIKKHLIDKDGGLSGSKNKERGPEMIKSITYILNEIEDKQTIPKQWNDINITSIPKNKEKDLKKGTILRKHNLQNL